MKETEGTNSEVDEVERTVVEQTSIELQISQARSRKERKYLVNIAEKNVNLHKTKFGF